MRENFMAAVQAEAELHSIYVIGGQGQRGDQVTEDWIRSREKEPGNADRAVAFWKKQVKAGYGKALGAFDCSGLGVFYLMRGGLLKSDRTAHGLWGLTTPITRNQVRRGDWVFEIKDGRATHIGYALSIKKAVEARGRDYGVTVTDIDRRNWNAFGRPTLFQVGSVLKKGDKGDEVTRLQAALIFHGYSLPLYGADGSFGSETGRSVQALQLLLGLPQTGEAGQTEITALGLSWTGKDNLPQEQLNAMTADMKSISDISGKYNR